MTSPGEGTGAQRRRNRMSERDRPCPARVSQRRTLPTQTYTMNPRFRTPKFFRFGMMSRSCWSLSPNHLPSVAAY